MKIITIIIILLVSPLILSGCSLYGTQNSSNTDQTNQTSKIGSNQINIQNFAFNPGTLTVKKGTTVTWINNDSTFHQIKSATFNSKELAGGDSFSFTFNNLGTFDYSCAIHPSMTGKILVE